VETAAAEVAAFAEPGIVAALIAANAPTAARAPAPTQNVRRLRSRIAESRASMRVVSMVANVCNVAGLEMGTTWEFVERWFQRGAPSFPDRTRGGSRESPARWIPACLTAWQAPAARKSAKYSSRITRFAFLHAHPDDEILTGGLIAALRERDHEAVIVTATDGVMGELPEGGSPRIPELRRSGQILGATRVECLGYADSGKGPILYPDPPDRRRFVAVPVEQAASRVAGMLSEMGADVLVHYDQAGIYHHPDHVRVHEVGSEAAKLAGTPCVLEATVPRERVLWWGRLARRLRLPFPYGDDALLGAGTPRTEINHVFSVRRWLPLKRSAIACHATVLASAGRSGTTLTFLLMLPLPVLQLLLGTEWYRTVKGSCEEILSGLAV
jgi:LmbE family N-acetylglucosaminyl deacetylase